MDFGIERERHLAFLVECRGAFGSIDELKVGAYFLPSSKVIDNLTFLYYDRFLQLQYIA